MPIFSKETAAAKLAAAGKRLAERQAALATSEKIVASVETDRDQIAAREHAGELSSEQAAEAFDEIGEKELRHRSEITRLTRAVALGEKEVAGLERDEALAVFGEAADRAGEARKAALTASATVAKHLISLVGATARLERAREAADQLAAAAAGLHPDGELAAGLPIVDEPGWPASAALQEAVDVILAGPVQPVAAGVASAERAAAASKRQDDELVNQCVAGLAGLVTAADVAAEIGRLPERLQERAWERARALNAHARRVSEEREQRERAQRPQRVLR